MRAMLLKLPENVLITCRLYANSLHLSTAAYTRCAIERMNRTTQALLQARRLAEASKKVRKESLRINREFEALK